MIRRLVSGVLVPSCCLLFSKPYLCCKGRFDRPTQYYTHRRVPGNRLLHQKHISAFSPVSLRAIYNVVPFDLLPEILCVSTSSVTGPRRLHAKSIRRTAKTLGEPMKRIPAPCIYSQRSSSIAAEGVKRAPTLIGKYRGERHANYCYSPGELSSACCHMLLFVSRSS
ncbi:hypothetical protein F5B21DRAFT_247562 [Xylaria acuta]|nr:hypothetical protein F5B21DRAFT_247562 [Xylaria acuta]